MSSNSAAVAIPQPRPRPIVGNIPDLDSKAPVQALMRLARQYGPIFRLHFPGRVPLILSSRELVADACDEKRFEKHVHGPLVHIRDIAGDALFTAYADEPNWGKAHRLLMPAFGPQAMRNYFEDMLDVADQMFTKWERLGPEEALSVTDNMTRLTLDTIALCGFAYRFNSFYQREMHPFVEAMVRALEEAGARSKRLPIQNQLMLLSQRQYQADAGYMRQVTEELIARRRKVAPENAPRDLLGLMLNSTDTVTGERLDDENIRKQLVTFLIAGHETTSGLLSFATWLLLKNPHAMNQARAEVDRVLGHEMPRFEQLAELHYIDAVMRETLRLYPTAPVFAVHPKQETTLAGKYPVTQNDILMVLLPMLHRDPEVWKDPEVFDPDRFAPEVRSTIPDKAWLPFGNGVRACIGRSFAWQEATLVLAMMLQRFEIWSPEPYELRIKETLTMKPEGLQIRARVRQPVARRLSARPQPKPEATHEDVPAPAVHGTPLLLLYGSNSGASEAFARRIASDGQARGYVTRVAPLDDATGKLPKDGAVVIVSSSYNGQPPDNARAFQRWIVSVPDASLVGVRYAVFGCGNQDWGATYQAVPKLFDEHLHRAGAQAILPRGEADARGDFFGDFEHWYAPLWSTFGEVLGVTSREVAGGPLYKVDVVPSSGAELVQQNRLNLATVVESRELVDVSSPFGRSKRHVELALPSGVSYAAGDYLAVLPENPPELVERAAHRFQLRGDAAVVLHSTRGAMSASLPTEKPVSVAELLGRHVELTAAATRKDLERLAARNPCPPHRDHLAAIAADPARYQAEILQKRVSVLDLVEKYTSCDIAFAEFLEMLPAMRVRQYSISSSPRVDPSRCSLTVAVVDSPAWSGIGQFRGTCSSYLARLHPGDQIAIAVRTPHNPFHPPASNETPIIMACAGTGLAPFRGFLQERAARKAAGERTGEAALFFGCDHPDVDFLYRAQIEEWEKAGVTEVFPAFCHKPDGDIAFVQHRLWKERARVRELLDRGAIFFVCGDGSRMAPALRSTLAKIHQEGSGCTEAEAAEWVSGLERSGRYVADVFA